MKLDYNEKKQRVEEQCRALIKGDRNVLPGLVYNLNRHSGFDKPSIQCVRFALLLWIREYERSVDRLGDGYPGYTAGWLEEGLIDAIAYGWGTEQDLFMAKDLYALAWNTYRHVFGGENFVRGLINIGFTVCDPLPEEVAQDKYDEELMSVLDRMWGDSSNLRTDVNVPWVNWWGAPDDVADRVQRFLHPEEVHGESDEDYWSLNSFVYECELYLDPARRDIVGDFWCGNADGVKERLSSGSLDVIGPHYAAELCVRHFADDVSVMRELEKRWPGAIASYRDRRGRSIADRMRSELIFGAWRRFFGKDELGQGVKEILSQES